jgi:hypothetical protein
MIRYCSRRAPDVELRARLQELAKNAAGLAIADNSFCCVGWASHRGTTASIGSIEKKGLPRASDGPAVRFWHPGADPGGSEAERPNAR